EEHRGEVDESSWSGRREQNADHVLAYPKFSKAPRQEHSAAESGEEANFGALTVGQSKAARVAASAMDKGLGQSLNVLLAAVESVGSKVLHGAAYVHGGGSRRKLSAKGHADGVGNVTRKFPEEAAAGEAEDRAPHAVEIHRNDGRVDALHDA